jgi:hypothetical protein
MNLWRNVTDPAVRGQCQANGMVVISRQFRVPAAKAIRRAGTLSLMSGD